MNFRLLAALLAASEATFDVENTPYGDRIENRWNLLRRWVKDNLKGHTGATKTPENQNPKAYRKIDRGEKYMLDYYKRKLAKHEDYDLYARCSGIDEAHSSVPDVTDPVGTKSYAIKKMNKVIADVFTEECKFKPAKSEARRIIYEDLLMTTFTRWQKQCFKINPFYCDSEYCISKQVGWGTTKCRKRKETDEPWVPPTTEDDAGLDIARSSRADDNKYVNSWWMNYD